MCVCMYVRIYITDKACVYCIIPLPFRIREKTRLKPGFPNLPL